MAAKAPAQKTRDTEGDLRKLVDEGVQILHEAWRAERQLTYDEECFFRQSWLLSQWETDRLLRKYESIRDRQEIAGTAADRAALAKAADDAAAICETKGSELRTEIEKLQRKLNQLERDRDLTAKRRDQCSRAVDELREKLPTPLMRLFDDKRLHIKRELLSQSEGLKNHAAFLDTLLSLDTADQSALSTLHSHAETRELVTAAAGTDRMIRYHIADAEAYQAWRADAEQERDEALKESERLRQEHERASAELDSLRDYWVK